MSRDILENARILLGVTGGIAAYKSAELCRIFARSGAEVQVVMTPSATQFVGPLTFETLTGRPVYRDVFDRDHGWEVEHVSYAQWAHVLVIAPSTANCITKLVNGMADDALSTTALAFRGPLVLAPAMNTAMWENDQTRENLLKLEDRGARIVEPGSGSLACGDVGAGRLADLEKIRNAVRAALESIRVQGPLTGKDILITAGPTAEPLDPVRHLSNPSTGRMGFALAEEATRRGARVTLVLGPTPLDPPKNLACVCRVQTAHEMDETVARLQQGQDVCIFAAAVADYAPVETADSKLKKNDAEIVLKLRRTPDIAEGANNRREPGQTLVGFAAETSDLRENAREKMERKGFDVVVANAVEKNNPAFAAVDNRVLLLDRKGREQEMGTMPKNALAKPIWDFVIEAIED